jgi:hypothetical protein
VFSNLFFITLPNIRKHFSEKSLFKNKQFFWKQTEIQWKHKAVIKSTILGEKPVPTVHIYGSI